MVGVGGHRVIFWGQIGSTRSSGSPFGDKETAPDFFFTGNPQFPKSYAIVSHHFSISFVSNSQILGEHPAFGAPLAKTWQEMLIFGSCKTNTAIQREACFMSAFLKAVPGRSGAGEAFLG